MLARSYLSIFSTTVFLFSAFVVRADEGITRTGKVVSGSLQIVHGSWVFRVDQATMMDLHEFSYLRFRTSSTPLPKAPPTRTLLLPNEQRLTGSLLALDAKNVTFVSAWGQTLILPRDRIVGIEQANASLPILHDDFETSLKAWRFDGTAGIHSERAFFGKSSLLLDPAVQSAAREWQPALRDGSVRLFFHHGTAATNLRWTVSLILKSQATATPGLVIDGDGYSCFNMKRKWVAMKPSTGWHMLSMELEAGRLRVYVDDALLGQTTLPRTQAIQGIRCNVDVMDANKKQGKLWLDELIVSQSLPPLARPPSDAKQDSLWLAQGEQMFGQIVSADAKGVTLDAKFGQRSYAWSQLRGLLLARPKESPMSGEAEILFRPSPGFPVDRLRGKLIRWEEAKLIVQHELLGEIAIERDRLDKIRFETSQKMR